MYSKEQASRIRERFWTTFGQYIAPHPSEEGLKVNWINYKTGLKNVYFRMKADKKSASIGIEITHQDTDIQELFFEQFQELRLMLEMESGEAWDWVMHDNDEYGKTYSHISKSLSDVSIYREEDWPELISFFKPRIIALDVFWSNAKYAFDSLK